MNAVTQLASRKIEGLTQIITQPDFLPKILELYPTLSQDYYHEIKTIIDLGICNTEKMTLSEFRSMLSSLYELEHMLGQDQAEDDDWSLLSATLNILPARMVCTGDDISMAMQTLIGEFSQALLADIGAWILAKKGG